MIKKNIWQPRIHPALQNCRIYADDNCSIHL